MQIHNGTLNNIRLIAHLRDIPDIKQTADGHIAILDVWTQGPYLSHEGEFTNNHIEWHRVIARDAHALLLARYGRPNMKLYIEGKLHSRRIKCSDTEEKIVTEIVADKFQPITSKDQEILMH